MSGMVMARAEWNQIVERRDSTVLPVVDVVGFAVLEGNGALGHGTGFVNRPQGPTLMNGCKAFASPDIERDTLTSEHHRDDLGIAREASDGFDREAYSVLRRGDSTGSETSGERFEPDMHDDLGANCARF